jgi:hypothetical protein
MNNFFLLITLIAISVLLLSCYYTGRRRLHQYRQDHLRAKMMRKLYEDERLFICNYLRTLLQELKKGELGWLQIASRIYPQDKIEIIFNHLNGNIQMQHRCPQLDKTTTSRLGQLGLTAYAYRGESTILSMPVNSKIVTDLVYFCLEEVYGQKRAKNIKITISGGLT